MDTGFLKYKKSAVHFKRFGAGQSLLIALHGFADEASMFSVLQNSLGEKYTVYCLDLPYHGLTKWRGEAFDQKDIIAVVKIILEKESKQRFDLMGFSMGGRIVQKILFDCIENVDKVYLIAPDGLDTKWMFKVNLIPGFLKSFLKWILQKPNWFIKLIRQLYHWKLISRFIYNFVYYHLHTEKKSARLFNTWRALDHFRIQPRKVKKLLQEYNLPVALYLGNRDEVVPLASAKLLSEDMPNVKVYVLDEGHLLVNDQLDQLLAQQLRNP